MDIRNKSDAQSLGSRPPLVAELLEGWMTVADVGCYGWRLAECCRKIGSNLIGIDTDEPPGRPSFASFAAMKNGGIDLPDGIADMVVASHVIEHIPAPVDFFWKSPGSRALVDFCGLSRPVRCRRKSSARATRKTMLLRAFGTTRHTFAHGHLHLCTDLP